MNLIERNPGYQRQSELMFKLKITKQSLNRVIRDLIGFKNDKTNKDDA